MLTSGGRIAATAGGPIVTSVVPVISLWGMLVQVFFMLEGCPHIPEQGTIISYVVSTNAVGFQVTKKQTLVHVRRHCSLGDFTNILLGAVRDVIGVSVRILAHRAVTTC